MSLMHRHFFIVLFPAVLLIACAGTGSHSNLRYPIIDPTALKVGSADCDGLDHYLRQVDSIRWSMREDGVELETDFEHVVQLSFATAAAIAIAVPLASVGVPSPTLVALPYAAAYTEPDNLKRTDALLIALLAKRKELHCSPHPDCVIQNDELDTLTTLRAIREQVESKEIPELEGLHKLTAALDKLCPVGKHYLLSAQR
jgi:hypothetical protein